MEPKDRSRPRNKIPVDGMTTTATRPRRAAIRHEWTPPAAGGYGGSILIRYPAKFDADAVKKAQPMGLIGAAMAHQIRERFLTTGKNAAGVKVGYHNVTGKMWESLRVNVNARRARVFFGGSSYGARVRWKWPGGVKPTQPRAATGRFLPYPEGTQTRKVRVVEVDTRKRIPNGLKAWRCSDVDRSNILTPSIEEAAMARKMYAGTLRAVLDWGDINATVTLREP